MLKEQYIHGREYTTSRLRAANDKVIRERYNGARAMLKDNVVALVGLYNRMLSNDRPP